MAGSCSIVTTPCRPVLPALQCTLWGGWQTAATCSWTHAWRAIGSRRLLWQAAVSCALQRANYMERGDSACRACTWGIILHGLAFCLFGTGASLSQTR